MPRKTKVMAAAEEDALAGGLSPVGVANSGRATVEVVLDSGKTPKQQFAEIAVDGVATAAALMQTFTERGFKESENSPSIGDYGRALHGQVQPILGGDLENAERLLAMQAYTLNSIFAECARIAAQNLFTPDIAETYLRLAMRAQNQSRGTVETLAEIKNPRIPVFAKQANIANNQQVNNGDAIPRAETQTKPNELRTIEHERILDPGAAGAGAKGNLPKAAVVSFDRAKNRRRKGALKP